MKGATLFVARCHDILRELDEVDQGAFGRQRYRVLARSIAHHLQGERVPRPADVDAVIDRAGRDRIVRGLRRAGISIPHIASRIGISERQVFRILSRR